MALFADRTSCHYFVHNQLRVLLSALAYVLVDDVRRVAVVATGLAQAQVAGEGDQWAGGLGWVAFKVSWR